MLSRDELQRLRRLAEWPATPLAGSLAVINADTSCDWCRGQGRDEAACALDVTDAGTWIVAGRYGAYHVGCAALLGWVASEQEAAYLAGWPRGPYA